MTQLTEDQAIKAIDKLNLTDFIDRKTRSIVVDLILYNPYTDFYTLIVFKAIFEPNGLINPKMQLYNMKRKYYDGNYARMGCEIAFVCLLFFYMMIEINEIRLHVKTKKKKY